MSANELDCNDEQLLTMLNDELPEAEADLVLDHIEGCRHCQSRLDELAASPDDWQKAAEVLAEIPTEYAGLKNLRLSHSGEQAVVWTESMARQLLSPPSHPEMLGRLGRYEVERLIGVGGMGIVFRASDSELNRPVAVKLLAPYLASSGPARRRFDREARAAAAVVHQHVVPIHNVETEREAPFLVMHFVPGESLQARLDRDGALEVCEILRIGMQVASGLAAAHQQGLVHRDIKPSNILLEDGVERALITDFGLARAVDDASVTHTGTYVGTPQYMSPEQARGEAVDQQSDLFSLGSVLYALCTGRPPFRAETTYGVIRRIAEDHPTPIRELNPEIPEWLNHIVERLMAGQRSERFESAAEVHRLLERCLSHVRQPAAVPLPEELTNACASRSTAWGRRIVLMSVVAPLLMLLAGIVYYIQTDYGVVKVDVRDPALNVSIDGQAVTMRVGNRRPIKISAGEKTLIVERNGAKFETKKFLVPRGDKDISISVELLPGKVVVTKDGQAFQAFPQPDAGKTLKRSGNAGSHSDGVANDTGRNEQDDLSPPTVPPTRNDPSTRADWELNVVERVSVRAIVDDCNLVGSFTDTSAVLSLSNPTTQERHVTFNYHIAIYGPAWTGTPKKVILKSGACDVTLAPGQSQNEVFNLTSAPGVDLPDDHNKDTAIIQVSKTVLPLSLHTFPPEPAPHFAHIRNTTSTIALWEFKDRLPFPRTKSDLQDSQEVSGSPFVKIMTTARKTGDAEEPVRRGRIALSDDLRFLAVGSDKIQTWNVKTATPTSPVTWLDGGCTQLGFAPNSSIAWFMDYGGVLRLWNAETGELIRNDKGPARGEFAGTPPAFSPDGKIMASPNRPGKLEFWDLEANALIKLHDTRVSKVEFSSDGKYCFSYRKIREIDEYGLFVWEPRSGRLLAGPFPDSRVTGSSWGVYGVGSRSALYSAKTGRLWTFENDDEPGGTEMVVRSSTEEGWPELRRVPLPFQAFHVYWLDDAHLLVIGVVKGANPDRPDRVLVKVPVDATDATQVDDISPKNFAPYRFALDRAGSRWLDVRRNSVSCYKVGEKTPIWSKDIPQLNWRVRGEVGNDGWVLVHDQYGSGFVFDLKDGSELLRKASIGDANAKESCVGVFAEQATEVWRYAKPDGDKTVEPKEKAVPVRHEHTSLTLPTSAWPKMVISADGQTITAEMRSCPLAMWDLATGKRHFVFKGGHKWQITDVVLSPDGRLLATASTDRTAMLWNAESGDRIAVLEGHTDGVLKAIFSPTGRYLLTAAGLNKNDARIWDGNTGQPVSVLDGHTDVIEHARFSRDERLILTGARDNTARLWNAETGREIHRFEHRSMISSVEFSPDEQSLLTSSGGRRSQYLMDLDGVRATEMNGRPVGKNCVRLWDAQTGERKLQLDHPAGVKAVFSNDAEQIVTVCKDAIAWWDVETGKKLATANCGADDARNTRFTPDRRYLIVLDLHKTARLWDLTERKPVCEFLTGYVAVDQISSDSRTFYSLTRHGSFRAWPIQDRKP